MDMHDVIVCFLCLFGIRRVVAEPLSLPVSVSLSSQLEIRLHRVSTYFCRRLFLASPELTRNNCAFAR